MFSHHLRCHAIYLEASQTSCHPLSVCDSPVWLQLILTHEHADAMLGLDNVRGVQPFNANNDIPPTPVFVSQHTMDRYKAWDATSFWIVKYQLCGMIPALGWSYFFSYYTWARMVPHKYDEKLSHLMSSQPMLKQPNRRGPQYLNHILWCCSYFKYEYIPDGVNGVEVGFFWICRGFCYKFSHLNYYVWIKSPGKVHVE